MVFTFLIGGRGCIDVEIFWSLRQSDPRKYRLQTMVYKEERLTILSTYVSTINQVPHVFGEHYFAGHKHKYME